MWSIRYYCEILTKLEFSCQIFEKHSNIIIIIIIIMFMNGRACFLFLNPQDEVNPSISSLVVLCSFVLVVDIVVLVLALSANSTPTSTNAKATWPLSNCSWNCSRRERVKTKVQRIKTGPIQLREHTPTEKHAGLEASRWQPLISPYDGLVTYPGDFKILIKSSKGRNVSTKRTKNIRRPRKRWRDQLYLED